jgi:hypothetical protein
MANFSLLARFGVDTKSLENGLLKAEKHVSVFRRSMAKAGAVLSSFGPAIGGLGFAAMTRHVIDSANEISNLSKIAGENVEDFQRMSHASRTVGISQEKLADILKDVNDKVGDFMQTGAGPMKDFFEQVAPKVGVTAEQFKNLSGSDALQLYVDSLEKANLSQSDMTFYMEAIASDATALIPLLKENGKLFNEIGGSLKSPMTAEEIAKMKEAKVLLSHLGSRATILGARGLTGVASALSMDVSRRDIAKAQLKQEGAFEGLGFFSGRKERKRLIDERVKLNAELKAKNDAFYKEQEEEAKRAAEWEAQAASGKFFEEKTPEEKREEALEALKERIREVHLEQLRAQESGDKKSADALKYRLKLMERSLDLMKKHNIGIEEAAKLAAADLESKTKPKKKPKPKPDKTLTLEEKLEEKLREIEKQRIVAQAAGDKAAEESLTRRVQLAEQIIRLIGKGFSQEEATRLANQLTEQNKPEDTRGDFVRDLSGHDLRRAANEAAKDGIRFTKMADGTFQRYIDGSRKGRFTEEQLRAGLEKQIEKDPRNKTLNDIKSILQGKFVNE